MKRIIFIGRTCLLISKVLSKNNLSTKIFGLGSKSSVERTVCSLARSLKPVGLGVQIIAVVINYIPQPPADAVLPPESARYFSDPLGFCFSSSSALLDSSFAPYVMRLKGIGRDRIFCCHRCCYFLQTHNGKACKDLVPPNYTLL